MQDPERKRQWYREQKKWLRPEVKEYMRACSKTYGKRLRQRALSVLGTKCSRCGFDDIRALQIDHRFGGGTKERRNLSYPAYYLKILRNPERYQVLCANCNTIKRTEKGEW
jgi:hypothetical protein